MKSNTVSLKSKIALTVVIISLVLLTTTGYVIYQRTMVEWWLPMAIGFVISLVTAPLFVPRLKNRICNGNMIIVNLLYLFSGTLTVASLTMVSNYTFSDRETACMFDATVSGKFRKEHQRRRRISRNHYVNQGVWYSYHVNLILPDNRIKSVEVTFDEYRRANKGGKRRVEMQNGLFGFAVIKRHNVTGK